MLFSMRFYHFGVIRISGVVLVILVMDSEMLLEEVVDIIKYTDSDHLVRALDLYNANGIVGSEVFPFLNIVFDKAPQQLISRLSSIGFKGDIQVTKSDSSSHYAVFDMTRYQPSDALGWLASQ